MWSLATRTRTLTVSQGQTNGREVEVMVTTNDGGLGPVTHSFPPSHQGGRGTIKGRCVCQCIADLVPCTLGSTGGDPAMHSWRDRPEYRAEHVQSLAPNVCCNIRLPSQGIQGRPRIAKPRMMKENGAKKRTAHTGSFRQQTQRTRGDAKKTMLRNGLDYFKESMLS